MSSLTIAGIEKYYGDFHALKPTNLEVGDGEFVVLVGPSGCGKSTMLRMIAGLEEISAGRIMIGGKEVNNLPPRERDVAMVFQSYALYPHRTVRQNMGFSLKLRKFDKKTIAKRVGEAARMLKLEDVFDRYPKQLSGGQRQRVAMGRAIVRDPQLFLFDEPLSNLDAKLRVQMRGEIKELHQRLGTTTIYVTHDQVEAMTMADRIVVLNHGIVEQTGKPMDLYQFPVNEFVAGFLGSPAMNFFSGSLRDGVFICDDGELVLPDAPGAAAGAAENIRLGLRPEDIALCSAGDAQCTAHVRVVEPTGAEVIILLDMLGRKTTVVHRGAAPQPGARIGVEVGAGRAHFFCGDSGARLTPG